MLYNKLITNLVYCGILALGCFCTDHSTLSVLLQPQVNIISQYGPHAQLKEVIMLEGSLEVNLSHLSGSFFKCTCSFVLQHTINFSPI